MSDRLPENWLTIGDFSRRIANKEHELEMALINVDVFSAKARDARRVIRELKKQLKEQK